MITQEQLAVALTQLPTQFSLDDLLHRLYPIEEAWHQEWQATASRFEPGIEVMGTVVHKAPFGDFVEIGASEPALLEIIHIPTLTPAQYASGTYNPLGSTIKAWVLGLLGEHAKQLRLTQDPTNLGALNLPGSE